MDLTAFVDNQVDEHTDLIGLPVAQHPAGALAARALDVSAEELAPIMSTLFWQTIATDPTFHIALGRLGVRGPAETLRTIVVPHGAAGQYDLLVLDPTWGREATPQALPLGRFEADIGGPAHWADRVPELQERYGAAYSLPAETMATLLAAFQAAARPTVVAARAPDLVRTHATDQVARVAASDWRQGTVGVAAINQRHRRVLTTARHVVGRERHALVEGRVVRVLNRNQMVDSATLSHPGRIMQRGSEVPLGVAVTELCSRTSLPSFSTPAAFTGGRSGYVRTMVVGVDAGIAMTKTLSAACVYTEPDTVGGDSGAALVDSAGKLVGFCSERTAIGENPEMSVWIWAPQVFDVMGLRLLKGAEAAGR